MDLNTTPKSSRTHIAIIGRRNVGKSSFMNAFLGQEYAIVSEIPGTTTDPVDRAYELQPFGPIMLIDTAGIDDIGELGGMRIAKTREIIKKADCIVIMVEDGIFGNYEEEIISTIQTKKIPWIIVINKIDCADHLYTDFARTLAERYSVSVLSCSALHRIGINDIKSTLVNILESQSPTPPIVSDLVTSPGVVVLVIPVDSEAPRGRIILPQAQTMSELLLANIPFISVKETELTYVLNNVLKDKPQLVITDSQAFGLVSRIVPEDIPLTSFSILFARQKGDLATYVEGLKAISNLSARDKILIAELCSHRPIGEDIGRIKIPLWLKQHTGLDLIYDVSVGDDFPDILAQYKLIIQCGGCMVNRQYITARIHEAQRQGVAITNYGVVIAYLHGIDERALRIFNMV